MRMSSAQVNWFIEGLLLRKTYLQPKDHAYDICVTLDQMVAEAIQQLTQEELFSHSNRGRAKGDNPMTRIDQLRGPGYKSMFASANQLSVFWNLSRIC